MRCVFACECVIKCAFMCECVMRCAFVCECTIMPMRTVYLVVRYQLVNQLPPVRFIVIHHKIPSGVDVHFDPSTCGNFQIMFN